MDANIALCHGEINVYEYDVVIEEEATFGCALIHNGSPQRVAPHLAERFQMPDALPEATPKGFVSSPGIKQEIFGLLCKCVNRYVQHDVLYTNTEMQGHLSKSI